MPKVVRWGWVWSCWSGWQKGRGMTTLLYRVRKALWLEEIFQAGRREQITGHYGGDWCSIKHVKGVHYSSASDWCSLLTKDLRQGDAVHSTRVSSTGYWPCSRATRLMIASVNCILHIRICLPAHPPFCPRAVCACVCVWGGGGPRCHTVVLVD